MRQCYYICCLILIVTHSSTAQLRNDSISHSSNWMQKVQIENELRMPINGGTFWYLGLSLPVIPLNRFSKGDISQKYFLPLDEDLRLVSNIGFGYAPPEKDVSYNSFKNMEIGLLFPLLKFPQTTSNSVPFLLNCGPLLSNLTIREPQSRWTSKLYGGFIVHLQSAINNRVSIGIHDVVSPYFKNQIGLNVTVSPWARNTDESKLQIIDNETSNYRFLEKKINSLAIKIDSLTGKLDSIVNIVLLRLSKPIPEHQEYSHGTKDVTESLEPDPLPPSSPEPASSTDRSPLSNVKFPHITSRGDIKHIITSRRDSLIILHLWASWCKPCTLELPSLTQFYLSDEYTRLQGEGVTLLTINFDLKEQDLRKFVSEKDLPFPIYYAESDAVYEWLNVEVNLLPRTIIYNKKGRKLSSVTSQDWQSRVVLDRIKDSLTR